MASSTSSSSRAWLNRGALLRELLTFTPGSPGYPGFSTLTSPISPLAYRHPAPCLTGVLAQAESVAEASASAGHFAMKLHVAGQFLVEAAAVQQISNTAKEFVHKLPVTKGAHRIHTQRTPGRP